MENTIDWGEIAEEENALTVSYEKQKESEMSMMAWMSCINMEGKVYCPQCGRYAKGTEIGSRGGKIYDSYGECVGYVSMYGHTKGFGCNK